MKKKYTYLICAPQLGVFGATELKGFGYVTRSRKLKTGQGFNHNGHNYKAVNVIHYTNTPPGPDGRVTVKQKHYEAPRGRA